MKRFFISLFLLLGISILPSMSQTQIELGVRFDDSTANSGESGRPRMPMQPLYIIQNSYDLSLPTLGYDVIGQRLKTILAKQMQLAGSYTLQIPISDFSTGTYFLTISSGNQTKTEKLIINNK